MTKGITKRKTFMLNSRMVSEDTLQGRTTMTNNVNHNGQKGQKSQGYADHCKERGFRSVDSGHRV